MRERGRLLVRSVLSSFLGSQVGTPGQGGGGGSGLSHPDVGLVE